MFAFTEARSLINAKCAAQFLYKSVTFGGIFERYTISHFRKNKSSIVDAQKLLDKHKPSNKVLPEGNELL